MKQLYSLSLVLVLIYSGTSKVLCCGADVSTNSARPMVVQLNIIKQLEKIPDEELIEVYIKTAESGKLFMMDRSFVEANTLNEMDFKRATLLRNHMSEILTDLFSPRESKKIMDEISSASNKHKRYFWLKILTLMVEERYAIL